MTFLYDFGIGMSSAAEEYMNPGFKKSIKAKRLAVTVTSPTQRRHISENLEIHFRYIRCGGVLLLYIF